MASTSNKAAVILIVLITLVFAKLQINKRSDGKDICFNICGDGRGYYAWLPAVFIYHDLNFTFFDRVETRDSTCGCQVGIPIQDYRYSFDGKMCNKYYPGASFMMLPFFAIAHIATKTCTNYAPNGYSELYFRLMALSSIVYYLIGMLMFLGILQQLKLNAVQKMITIVLMTFGTNIMYYCVDAPLYSHIYSFALIAAFIYHLLCLKEKNELRRFVYLSFLAGLIFVTRPVNITVFLLIPFILGADMKRISGGILKKLTRLLLLLPGVLMPALLLTLYKLSTGNFFIYSYGKEGFDFLHPHFFQFIFHVDNGIFPYMPLLFMPLLFIPVWYKKENRALIAGSFATLLITIYIHSSWWAWTYGYSFGARTILDITPIFGIMLALSLKQSNARRYFYLLPVYCLCCVLTMLLYHQKSHGGYMNQYPITDYKDAIYNAIGIK